MLIMKNARSQHCIGMAFGNAIGKVLQAADTTAPAPTEKRHPKLRALLKHRAAIRQAVARRLDLTADQKAQIKSHREKTVAALKALEICSREETRSMVHYIADFVGRRLREIQSLYNEPVIDPEVIEMELAGASAARAAEVVLIGTPDAAIADACGAALLRRRG